MATTIGIPQLRALIVRRLSQKYSPEDAELMADSVLFGDLCGRASHGMARILPGSYGAMDEDVTSVPVIERTGPQSARITGGPGILVASMATKLVGELAEQHGMAVVTTTGSHSTSGSLTYYVEQLTNRDLVALVTTNTMSFITPRGGKQRMLGTNPLAVGIPTQSHPFVADLSTAAITGGEVVNAATAGAPLPEDVAVDADGNTTTDPAAVLDGGALLPFGGHKGLGLSMMVQLLSGVLAGSSDLPIGPQDDWSHFFLAISLATFGDASSLKESAQSAIDAIRSTETQDGSEVRIPGHQSLARRDAALEKGVVDVEEDHLRQLLLLLDEGFGDSPGRR